MRAADGRCAHIPQQTMAAAITKLDHPLLDESGRDLRIFLQPLSNRRFERVELAAALAFRRSLRWRVQILLDGFPAHIEMALNLADRPVLGPVQPVQFVDLFACQHGFDGWCFASMPDSVIRQKLPKSPAGCCLQDSSPALCGAQVLQSPRLARELSCCLQDLP